MSTKFLLSMATGVAIALVTGVTQANINVSTGLDASNITIYSNNTADAHWIVDQPSGGVAPARVIADGNPNGAIPWAWVANGPGSSWITIDANTPNNAPVIPYTYYFSFNLSAGEAASASLSGFWAIDDGGELRLNGNLLSTLVNNYSMTAPFSAGSSLFVAGNNLLTITMTSSDNYLEAVRLEGLVTAVPEPETYAMLLAGLGLLGFMANRRKESIV